MKREYIHKITARTQHALPIDSRTENCRVISHWNVTLAGKANTNAAKAGRGNSLWSADNLNSRRFKDVPFHVDRSSIKQFNSFLLWFEVAPFGYLEVSKATGTATVLWQQQQTTQEKPVKRRLEVDTLQI